MFKRLIYSGDIRFRLNADASVSHSGDGSILWSWQISMRSKYIQDTTNLDEGFLLYLGSDNDVDDTTALLQIPDLGLNVSTATGSASLTADAELRFTGLKLYVDYDADNNHWFELKIPSVSWYVNGGLIATYTNGGSGWTLISGGLSPGHIPIFGLPAMVFADQGAGATGIGGPTEYEADDTITVNYVAGVQWQPTGAGAWVSAPVETPEVHVPPCWDGCAWCLDNPSNRISFIDSWNLAMSLHHHAVSESRLGAGSTSSYYSRTSGDASVGRFWIVPNWPKQVERMVDDYGALVLRGGLPRVVSRGTRACGESASIGAEPPFAHGEIRHLDQELHQRHTEFLGTVQNADHVIEDPVLEPTYMMVQLAAGQARGQWILEFGSIGTPPTPEEPKGTNVAVISHHQVDTRIDNAVMWPYLSWDGITSTSYRERETVHAFQYLAHPLWSYFLWWPAEDASGTAWVVDETIVTPEQYWLQVRCQHLTHPALGADDLRWRNDISTEPLTISRTAGWIEGVTGFKTWWWGCPRPVLDTTSLPTQLTLDSDSSSAWTLEDCTATFGATISLTGSGGATSYKAKFKLGQLACEPYLWPLFADSALIGWVAQVNIVSITVKLVGVDGTEVTLGTTETTYQFPQGDASKYAGSWAEDRGNGVVSDTGTDADANGISSATMASGIRSTGYHLLPGFNAEYLVYEIVVTASATPTELDYPTFYAPAAADVRLFDETARYKAVLAANGPGARWGSLDYFIGGVFQDPPNRAAFVYMPNIVEGLAMRRQMFEGRAPADGLDTELATYFESGTEYTLRKHLGDQDPYDGSQTTHSFLIPHTSGRGFRLLMIPSLGQVPPLSWFPHAARNDDMEPQTGLTNASWSLISTKRWLLSAGPKLPWLELDGPGTNISTQEPTVDGWSSSWHRYPTTGGESCTVRLGTAERASVRPFFGHLMIGDIGDDETGAGVSIDRSPRNRWVRAILDNTGTVFTQRGQNTASIAWEAPVDHALTGVVDVCVRWAGPTAGQTLLMLTAEGGSIKLRTSTDEGRTFGMATTIGTGTKCCCEVTGDGRRCFYWIDGDAVKGKIYDAAGNVLENTFTVIASGVDDAQIDCRERTYASGRRQMVLLTIESGTVKERLSDDLKTFS